MNRAAVLVVALLVSVGAMAGPFGLEMGTSIDELRKSMTLKESSTYTYEVESGIPQKHPDFYGYKLVVTPEHGLCKIVALAGPIKSSVYGTELRSSFQSIEEALSAKYGAPKKLDRLRTGSIWDEPKDWMIGLNKGERSLFSIWSLPGTPDSLSDVVLEAKAVRVDQGGLILMYEFTNAKACLALLKNQKNSAL